MASKNITMIERERRVFEELAYPNAKVIDFDGTRYVPRTNKIYQIETAEHANRLLAVWLAAKAHALNTHRLELFEPVPTPTPQAIEGQVSTDQAKSYVMYETSNGEVVVRDTYGSTFYFKCRATATSWLEKRGL